METTAFEIISPERILLSGQAQMIVAPGVEGDFGVLPGHAPLISGLRPGVVTIYENDAPSKRIFVGGGIAEAMPQGCSVLAEDAMPVEEINAQEVGRRITDLQNAITSASGEDERNRLEAALAIAQAQLEAVN